MDQILSQVSAVVAFKTGLCFPTARNSDLERALLGATRELGLDGVACFAAALLADGTSPTHLSVLVRHLTVGETYFWRDRSVFDALAQHVIPELRQRRTQQRRLRVWSAACCTGEEAYSLAILLQQCLPDWQDWDISILGTDINEIFLQRAAAGIYGEWSFRGVPAGFKERYFTRPDDGHYAILPQIRQMVRFASHNLINPPVAVLSDGYGEMDLILCRNVLMYLTPEQASRVVSQIHGTLAEHSWLTVAATECSQVLFGQFETRHFPNAILYRNSVRARQGAVREPLTIRATSTAVMPPTRAARDRPPPATATPVIDSDAERRARELANNGRLQEALDWCQRWLAADALASGAHYLRAMILQELGRTSDARRAFKQTLYLKPQFTLAHVGLGNLARAEGRSEQAIKHFSHALDSLRDATPDDPLEEGDGLTVQRLQGILTSMLAFEPAL